MKTPEAATDTLLLPFLQAADDAEAQRHLARLLQEHADPIIRATLSRRLRVSLRRVRGPTQSREEQDAEDLYGDVVAQIVARLQELRGDRSREAIGRFPGYVAITAHHACDGHLRRCYPERWRLTNRLRYLLTRQPGLDLWEDESGAWRAGFAVWRNERRSPPAGRLQQLRENPQVFVREAGTRAGRGWAAEDPARMNPADLLASIFDGVGAPIELDDLVSAVAALCHVQETVTTGAGSLSPANEETRADPLEGLVDTGADVAAEVEQRAYLRQLWAEIRQLPPRQCAALLLNLRDTQGRGVIALLPILGIATVREVAAALGIPAERFAGLWNDLPLDDTTIATHLGITRQQVINLRKVARERLARWLRKW